MASFERNLNIPAEHTSNWDVPLNENFENLNVRAIAFGSIAGRPVIGDDTIPPGGIYVVNDPDDEEYGAVYRYDALNNEWSLADRQFGALSSDGDAVATQADTFSGDYSDLTSVPSTFAPETHGDEAHSETYVLADEIVVSSTEPSSPSEGDLWFEPEA